MREAMLILHFIGLAMGIGTSIGFMFLGIAGSKLEKEEAKKFAINSFSLSTMGHIGITLLIITGGYLMTPYWAALTSMPLMMVKLGLVILLLLFIILQSRAAGKVKKGDESQMKIIRSVGKLSVLTSIAIVVMAVLQFR